MYATQTRASSASYNFRSDFSAIARPGLRRFLEASGYDPDAAPDGLDDCWGCANEYVKSLWRALQSAQLDHRLQLDTPGYDINTWTRESVTAYVDERLEGILEDARDAANAKPVDVDRAVRLGTEMARKQGLETGPEAIAYATDRLKSKIERDACSNPVAEVHAAILDYRHLAGRRPGAEVVYLDHHRLTKEGLERLADGLRREPKEGPKAEARERGASGESETKAEEAEPKAERRAPKKLSNTAAEIMAADIGKPAFIVDGWLQNRKVGLLLGEDGAGKSFLLLDLAIAVATGGIWFGIQTVRAPVLFMSAEEEKRDIKVRLEVGLERVDE